MLQVQLLLNPFDLCVLNEILNCFWSCGCLGELTKKISTKVVEYLLVLGKLETVLVYFGDRSSVVFIRNTTLSVTERATECCKC
jgi:hypothetical protein